MSKPKIFPVNSVLLVSRINKDKGYIFSETEDPLKDCLGCIKTDENGVAVETGKLFRMLVNEYGRCISRVYIDTNDSRGSMSIGWVFEKRQEYEDCRETYLQETWVSLASVTPKIYKHLHV